MRRAATFNVSAIGKNAVAYEGRPRIIKTVKEVKGMKPVVTTATRPFAQRFALTDVVTPAPKKRR